MLTKKFDQLVKVLSESTLTFKYSNVCISKYLNILISIYPNIYISEYPNIYISEYSNIYISEYLHIQIYLSERGLTWSHPPRGNMTPPHGK